MMHTLLLFLAPGPLPRVAASRPRCGRTALPQARPRRTHASPLAWHRHARGAGAVYVLQTAAHVTAEAVGFLVWIAGCWSLLGLLAALLP